MPNTASVFISYRNSKLAKMTAAHIFEKLENKGYKVYWDKDFILAGSEWNKEIYNSVLNSDVLIVLLEEVSEWIQREVDTARAAQIQILPLLEKDTSAAQRDEMLHKLDMDKKQCFVYEVPPDLDIEGLCERIDAMAKLTLAEQKKRVEALQDKWKNLSKKELARNRRSRTQFRLLGGGSNTIIHLASGPIQDFKNIDVIVNSENDHLQMSRIHDRNTVSSRLRYCGSWSEEGTNRIYEDSIQWELDAQVNYEGTGRPVAPARVLATNAGHPFSALRSKEKNNIRYIFHAIIVKVFQEFSEKVMTPIDEDGIQKSVLNCLKMVDTVNKQKGVISPPNLVMMENRVPREDEEVHAPNYQNIQSIIFPLLGTGHGGLAVQKTIIPIAEGIRDYLENYSKTTLTEIYICVYYEDDVKPVDEAMAEVFERV